MRVYNEEQLAAESRQLSRSARAVFAAACAERLWPLVERYATSVPMPAGQVQVLRRALDAVWDVVCGTSADLVGVQETAESLVPREDDDWVLEAGYAQNAIAAIAYAARAWLTDDPQEAVWAARQVYEAADYGAQQRDGSIQKLYSAAVEEELLESTVVQAALEAISDDLEAARVDSAANMRRRSRAEARAFAGLFP